MKLIGDYAPTAMKENDIKSYFGAFKLGDVSVGVNHVKKVFYYGILHSLAFPFKIVANGLRDLQVKGSRCLVKGTMWRYHPVMHPCIIFLQVER